jgi:hypothetical protein
MELFEINSFEEEGHGCPKFKAISAVMIAICTVVLGFMLFYSVKFIRIYRLTNK